MTEATRLDTAEAERIGSNIAACPDYRRGPGTDTEQRCVPAAFVRDRAYRAQYPGWEASSAAGGCPIVPRMDMHL